MPSSFLLPKLQNYWQSLFPLVTIKCSFLRSKVNPFNYTLCIMRVLLLLWFDSCKCFLFFSERESMHMVVECRGGGVVWEGTEGE